MENPPAPLATAIIPPPLEKFAPALGDVTRWQIVALLAAGEPLLVSEIAAKLGRDAGLISKHLARLREAGVVTAGRARLYQIPPMFLQTPGIADFGHCQLPAK